MKMFLRVGHRGARGYEVENTVASFRKAIKLGVNVIELDVRATKDGKIVVMHDPKVDRITNGKGRVKSLTLKQIKALDAKGEKIVSLDEALKFIDGKVKKIFIELKEVGLERKVLAAVKRRKLQKRVVITSFKEAALRNVRKLDKRIETGLIYVVHPRPIKAALKLKASYLIPLYRFTHTRNIEKAHEAGLKVVVWTINTRKEALAYKKKGVDGIASDKPDVLKGL